MEYKVPDVDPGTPPADRITENAKKLASLKAERDALREQVARAKDAQKGVGKNPPRK